MVLKFYYSLLSPPVRSVYLTIKTLNIDAELVEVNLAKGEHKNEEYLKINKRGTVPAVVDDGAVLVDSHTINIYLAIKYARDDQLYPSDPVQRAAVNELLFFESGELFPLLKNTTRKIIYQGFSSIEGEGDLIDQFENGYSSLEIYLKKGAYVAGDNLTIADFSVLATVTSMNVYVPVNEEKFPLLAAYLKRAKTLPHYTECNEVGLNNFRELLISKNAVLPLKRI